jgi:hypothetical protein
VRDDQDVWEEHDFDQGGDQGGFPEVVSNVNLVSHRLRRGDCEWEAGDALLRPQPRAEQSKFRPCLQIKGLFNTSLPEFLATQAVYAGLVDPVR